ncbi:MAG TPA: TetR/AcrR family transcriptional regulator [Jiangellales bacterium]|nr:TetR/AcrR family transcriptional regulator [Jiangellales bacterium]
MNARGRSTRERLLRATSEVVRDVGYAQASIRAVAQAAGIAEGTIYRHFPDKASLLLAAVAEQHAPIAAWMAELPDRAGRGEVVDVLTQCLTRLATLRETVLPLELAMLTDPDLAQRAAASLPDDGTDPPAMLTQYLAAEQRAGRLRGDVDPGEAAVLVLVTLFGLTTAPGARDSTGRVRVPSIRRTVELLLQGLSPP